jgi:hypothetical protein
MLTLAVALFLSATAAHAISPHLNTWTLVRVADSSALCLDGSPAAFYIRPGSNANAAKWIVHLEGGGWATDLGGHFSRSQVKRPFLRSAAFPLSQAARRSIRLVTLAQTALGSSLNYTSTASFDNFDILSSDASRNPDFHDWTGVYIKFAATACIAAAYPNS